MAAPCGTRTGRPLMPQGERATDDADVLGKLPGARGDRPAGDEASGWLAAELRELTAVLAAVMVRESCGFTFSLCRPRLPVAQACRLGQHDWHG